MVAIFLVTLAGLIQPLDTCSTGARKEPVKPVSELSLEVAALQLLYDLQVTNSQLEKLGEWAKESASKARPRKDTEVTMEFRTKLVELHKALSQAVDGESIEKFIAEVGELREQENPVLDDRVEITPAARKRTVDFARLLKPSQAAALYTLDGDTIDDPRDKLVEAIEDVRSLETEEWKATRDMIAGDIARLVAGIDGKRYDRVHDDVIVLLVKSRKLDMDEFQEQRKDLEKEALKLVGNLGGVDFLRNYLEYQLAELLSNPRLAAAVKERLATPEPKKKREDF